MKSPRLKTIIALMLFVFLGSMVIAAHAGQKNDKPIDPWKKLARQRIAAGIWINQIAPYRWGFQMTEIRDLLERIQFDQVIGIAYVFDAGYTVDLGTYAPRIETVEENGETTKKIIWDSIPNLKELRADVRIGSVDRYKVLFKNSEGKVKAAIGTRIRTM